MRDTGDKLSGYFQPAFLICVLVLALAGIGMDRLHVEKVPFRLKRPFDLFDANSLTHYNVISKERIDNEEVVRELGTTDYIQWILEDPDASEDSAVRKCLLFVTYYELPDYVPHVPEECYIGAGHRVLASDSVTFQIGSALKRPEHENIKGKYVVFSTTNSQDWRGDTKFSILYLFNVNGMYTDSRESARWILNKYVFSKYVYFSKVEWKFFNTKFGQTIYPRKEEAVAASVRLLSALLPVLEREFWPDWPVKDGSP
ncbi:MAG: hypothetical protein ACYTEQ_02570 [Planctomycetota bacterium]|jgi:hypothetical protein